MHTCIHTYTLTHSHTQVAYPLSLLGVSIRAMQQALKSLKG